MSVTCQGCGRSATVAEVHPDAVIECRTMKVTGAGREIAADSDINALANSYSTYSRIISAIKAKIGAAGFEDQLLDWTIDAKRVAKFVFTIGKKCFERAEQNNAQMLVGGKPMSFSDFGESIADGLNFLTKTQRSLLSMYTSSRSKLLQETDELEHKIADGVRDPNRAQQVKSWTSDARGVSEKLLETELQALRAAEASGSALKDKSGQTVTAQSRIVAHDKRQLWLEQHETQIDRLLRAHPQPVLLPERSPPRNPPNRGTRRVGAPLAASRPKRPPDGTAFWSARRSLSSVANVVQHARSHMQEFSITDIEAYRIAARDFVSDPPLTAETFTRDNGEVMIYDLKTNTFGVRTFDGAPATMFKPRDGLAYWVMQLRKYGGQREGRL